MRKGIFDTATVLRDMQDAARSTSGRDAALAFPLTPTHPDNLIGGQGHAYSVDAIFHNIVITGAPTNVAFVIEVDNAVGFPSAIEVGRLVVAGAAMPSELKIVVDLDSVYNLDPGATHIRCGIDITGGTSPTVDYGCFLSKSDRSAA